MTNSIHPTAILDSDVELDGDVKVGPYAVIGSGVKVGSGTEIKSHVVIESNTKVGEHCSIGIGSVLGGDPQDYKYEDEKTWLEIGDNTVIRDYSTLHRGSAASGVTRVGNGCYLMTYVHVAHDCDIGDRVVIANAVQLAGHVIVEDDVYIGGTTPVHQFVRIGTHAFIGGGSRLPQDVPPYTRAAGNPYKLYGINSIGLSRAGFDEKTRLALKHAYRILFNSSLSRAKAIEALQEQGQLFQEVARLLKFISESDRGVLT